jgi:hypothetical protein
MVSGKRNQAVVLVAAAIEPSLFSQVTVREGLESWSKVFDLPIRYLDAPELFCLELYRYFDVDRLTALAKPVRFDTVARNQ